MNRLHSRYHISMYILILMYINSLPRTLPILVFLGDSNWRGYILGIWLIPHCLPSTIRDFQLKIKSILIIILMNREGFVINKLSSSGYLLLENWTQKVWIASKEISLGAIRNRWEETWEFRYWHLSLQVIPGSSSYIKGFSFKLLLFWISSQVQLNLTL